MSTRHHNLPSHMLYCPKNSDPRRSDNHSISERKTKAPDCSTKNSMVYENIEDSVLAVKIILQ